ncbi:YbgC/FadM family acyl-CoA thioesterase [Ottowia sp.]|uniref:YbgC/FadM family acyl-CoA thioesterase n=1 Tax=Ottowia sp. TaxID=1898956 RepID=UPI001D314BA7|nr:YbgC/FadM family acyl-CoA thioesterase [Ottowia sp.]MCB2025397.1 YbgC/FadM family acyl-CoA thioesterase [Ottowia sp.]MCP5259651.1 YbgC/FadM family acyl-CoA thioesterase [Burkholderiaceae bacterium]HPR43766.1 YbgC/FadM family acyl-CoA thioesterase [Ottowia sp.]HRW71764.1 YbgC/FadM family acyl-CoA thioesterase [Ottowia sp.]
MKPSDFRFHHPLRVRWGEVDVQQIVFNPHYLMYFDVAVGDYWRALAMPYAAAMRLLDGDIFLRKTTVEFNASAQMEDRLDVALRCDRIGSSSMTFVGAIFRDHQLLVTGELVYVFADPVAKTSRPVPAPLRALMEGYEAGEPVTEVRTGDWATLGEGARAVREAVFVQEQGIAREDEWDEADHTAVHALVTNRLGMPVATGRLLVEGAPGSGTARIGRMAVDRTLRGSGVGRQVVQALEQAARLRGDTRVVLGAQRSAEGFYGRLGYTPYGEPYEEVGIPHVGMARVLG